MKIKPKTLFTLFYVLFFAIVIIGAMGYTRKARLIPLVVAIPCLAMSMVQLVADLRGKEKKKGRSIEDDLFHGVMEKMIHQEVGTEETEEKKGRKGKKGKKAGVERAKGLFKIIGWIGVFYFSIFLFGFLIAIPLFTVVYMRMQNEKWKLSAACAAGLWLTVYLAFGVAAKLTLYEGFVFRMLSHGE